ncbi:DUF4350 domain-containing protein [Fervidicoccus fontis]|uniref:DUF4350 domain-containing protein n=1 Tax=Fervidicoccus fontis TaxID=683846 RepID=A0A2J6NA19_9CREN|nr:DUF4350 domain-containing protein [Fervidicoccus fontis]PMB75748.1 MAG: hypothetical protein C0188_02030 [Fervidicoccus fontis]PMB78134.1 MAG: hypothetical protein C0177_01000 [Fervidicoccus fontis]HEW64202.1 hypothetical protein [Fervidicoccus fontis]
MKNYIILGTVLFLIIALFSIYIIPSTSDFSPYNPLYNGLADFVHEFNVTLIPINSLNNLKQGTVVFLIGPSKNFTEQEGMEILSYVENGGELVIMDDFGTSNELIKIMNLNGILNGSLLGDLLFMYKSFQLPIVKVNVNGTTLNVYYNYATVITSQNSNLNCIGESSYFSYLDLNLTGKYLNGYPKGPFCIAYMQNIGKGVVYVFSDSSPFINSMLNLGDNHKLATILISGKIPYLIDDKWYVNNYDVLRTNTFNFFSQILPSIVYPLALISVLASYIVGNYIYINLVKKRTKKKSNLEKILKVHPEWNKDVLIKLMKEADKNE